VPAHATHASTILVVEDDASTREGMLALLENDGYKVSSAKNGQEAIDLLEGGLRPAIMLIDLMLPKVSGWDLLRYVHADLVLKFIPIIVVTAAPDEQTSLVADHVFVKPVDITRLLALIRTLAR
jgi:CheY-like chemotaxis protein